MGKIKSFDTFINENYETDALFDLAAEVYDIIDYKDIENKTKVKSALKTLGHGTDPITVGRVIRKMKEVANESEVNESKFTDRIKMKKGSKITDEIEKLFIQYDFYVQYIDNYSQRKDAEIKNGGIKNKLNKLGVEAIADNDGYFYKIKNK